MSPEAREFPWLDMGLILLCWASFLLLFLYVWPHLGIAFGEELAGTAAYAWLHQIPNMMCEPHIRILGWNIPAMLDALHGPWNIYCLTPFIAVGGCTLAALRFYSAFMFLIALWGTWRLASLVSGNRTTAFLSTLLLAVCPMMIITSHSLCVTEPDIAASVWALCFGVLFVRTRKGLYACAACAALFIGLGSRSWVAGLCVGLMLFMALTRRRALALLPESNAAKVRLIAGLIACAGLVLLLPIACNAVNDWFTIKFFAQHAVARDVLSGARSNLNYWTNLKTSLSQLGRLCDGDEVVRAEPWHWLYVLPLLLSFLHAARGVWRRRTFWSASAMLWIVMIGYVLASAVSPTEQMPQHFESLAPVLCVLMFAWLDDVPAGLWRRAALLIMALICAAQFAGDFHLFRSKNINLDRTGDYSESPLLIEISRWAARHPRTPLISLFLPLTDAIPYFSQNRARLINFSPWADLNRIPWKSWLRRKDKPCFIVENHGAKRQMAMELRAHAARLGVALKIIKIFPDSAGRPAFEVYRTR
ncbi:MAG TPA: glycosyltransferase family 39 protein [Elusimicrobiota bacterium]|nr:glycosyltransferase family 39 protein [Elusimicrobiota bacterium]